MYFAMSNFQQCCLSKAMKGCRVLNNYRRRIVGIDSRRTVYFVEVDVLEAMMWWWQVAMCHQRELPRSHKYDRNYSSTQRPRLFLSTQMPAIVSEPSIPTARRTYGPARVIRKIMSKPIIVYRLHSLLPSLERLFLCSLAFGSTRFDKTPMTMMKKTTAILSLFFWPAASEVLVLTVENYEASTMGKSVFLKV
jgi:hypothetical protein